MEKFYVMRNDHEVIWCWEEEAFDKLTHGWSLYAIADSEDSADKMCEEACY
ncbi:hypothetical protein AB1K91_17870 [Terribacillus sp. 179-K 1B1 HS]|uniref:hypothetical protein n=1 Tax=Terribacillus sp. 179-K 1B1 HS TaxID=3142388 RepID=UPI0039A12C91